MEKRIISKMLAVAMSAGMFLQPVMVYAGEPVELKPSEVVVIKATTFEEAESAVSDAAKKLDDAEQATSDAASEENTMDYILDEEMNGTSYYSGAEKDLDEAEQDVKDAKASYEKKDSALSAMDTAMSNSNQTAKDSVSDSVTAMDKAGETMDVAEKVTENLSEDEASGLVNEATGSYREAEAALQKATGEYDSAKSQLEIAQKKYDEAKKSDKTSKQELENAEKELEEAKELVASRKEQVEYAKEYADQQLESAYKYNPQVQLVLSKEKLDSGEGSVEDYIKHQIHNYYRANVYNGHRYYFEDVSFGKGSKSYVVGVGEHGAYLNATKEYDALLDKDGIPLLFYELSNDENGNIVVNILNISEVQDTDKELVKGVEARDYVPEHWETEDGRTIETAETTVQYDDPSGKGTYLYDSESGQELKDQNYDNPEDDKSPNAYETSRFIKYDPFKSSTEYTSEIVTYNKEEADGSTKEQTALVVTKNVYYDKVIWDFTKRSEGIIYGTKDEYPTPEEKQAMYDEWFKAGYNWIYENTEKSGEIYGKLACVYYLGYYTETREKVVWHKRVTRYDAEKCVHIDEQQAVTGKDPVYGTKLVEKKINAEDSLKEIFEQATATLAWYRKIASKADAANKAYEAAKQAADDAYKKVQTLKAQKASSKDIEYAELELGAAQKNLEEAAEAKAYAEKSVASAKAAVESANAKLANIIARNAGSGAGSGAASESVSGSSSDSSDDGSGEASEQTSISYQANGPVPAGAITIVALGDALTAATMENAPAGPAVLGAERYNKATRAMTIKLSEVTDAQYKEAVISNINEAPAGGMLRIETDRIGCFDRAMLKAFEKRASVDLEVVFPFGSKKIRVVVPAGYDINKLLDEKGYCGFLRLLSLLGGEVIK